LTTDLRRLGDCASEVRGRLSSESWRIVGRLLTELDAVPRDVPEAAEKLDRLLLGLSALAGLAHDDMTQDDGWKIMMLGRRLERLRFLALLLSHRLGSEPPRQGDLEWVLDVGDSTITYRTRFLATPQLEPVLDLLVHDERNPRAMAYQWHEIRRLLAGLSRSLGETAGEVLEAAMEELRHLGRRDLDGSDELAADRRWEIGNALARVATAAAQLSDLLSARHFSHTDFELHAVAT
jgi:uncharacterized alpha-E superfamily protein